MKIRDCVYKVITLVNRNSDLNNLEITGTIISIRQCCNNGSSGMTYLTISDGDTASDKIDMVIYKIDDLLMENIIIKCFGGLQIYVSNRDSRKQLQFRVNKYEICGECNDNMYSKLKQQLINDHIITLPRKQIPVLPKKIGIIGGIKNDGTFDVLNKLNLHCFCDVYVYDTILKPSDMIERINYANTNPICDVLLIVRGGGSKEDLATLNDYNLAVCVKNSQIPIISGIGHTMDHTIIDDVSDKCCETPTATAYDMIDRYNDCDKQVEQLIDSFNTHINKLFTMFEIFDDKLNVINDAYDMTVLRFIDRFNSLISNINTYITSCEMILNSSFTQECWRQSNSIIHQCKLFKSIVINIVDVVNEKNTDLTFSYSQEIESYETDIVYMIDKLMTIENKCSSGLTHLTNELGNFNARVLDGDLQLLTKQDCLNAKQLRIVFLDGSVDLCIK